jgi:hypothetical protein
MTDKRASTGTWIRWAIGIVAGGFVSAAIATAGAVIAMRIAGAVLEEKERALETRVSSFEEVVTSDIAELGRSVRQIERASAVSAAELAGVGQRVAENTLAITRQTEVSMEIAQTLARIDERAAANAKTLERVLQQTKD